MAKYTKQDVIEQRKCGIKYWDEAVSLVGRAQVIKRAMEIQHKYPNIWGEGWPNLAWAFGNAVIQIVNHGSIRQSWNLDEALTSEEMNVLKITYNLDEYTPIWNRKVLKNKPTRLE